MVEVIGEFLPYAVGVAVSPVPIAAVLLMLVTRKARTNGPLFLFGWLAGLTVVGVIVLLIPGLETSQGEPSTTSGVVKGILGVLLLGVAGRAWMNRPAVYERAEAPSWMERVDGFNGPTAMGMGFLLSALNPKNLLLAVGGAATISAAALSTSQQYGALAVFVVVASLTILVPVVAYLALGNRAEQTMTSTKDWLIQNNQTVMSVLLLILSISFIGDAIEVLL